MLIKSFGLFWEIDEIDWFPGSGNRDCFRLLGRKGARRPGIRIANFINQRGIYILYNNYGPYYVGLTCERGLGLRLRDHLKDRHEDKWTRFSWFGFRELANESDNGIEIISQTNNDIFGNSNEAIKDIEALLIKAMGTANIQDMNFCNADEWIQIKDHEAEKYIKRINL